MKRTKDPTVAELARIIVARYQETIDMTQRALVIAGDKLQGLQDFLRQQQLMKIAEQNLDENPKA